MEQGKDYEALCVGLQKLPNISKVTILAVFRITRSLQTLGTATTTGHVQSIKKIAPAIKPSI